MGHTDSVMDSAESTAELLAAEREASQIIEKAIAARDTKMMSAKAEAEAEIAAFRGVLEAEYQAHSTKAEADALRASVGRERLLTCWSSTSHSQTKQPAHPPK